MSTQGARRTLPQRMKETLLTQILFFNNLYTKKVPWQQKPL